MKNNQYTATPNWFKDTTTSQTGSQVGQQVTNYYIQGGSSSGGTIDISQVWEALAADTTEQINKSHLTDALTGYATEQWITDQGFIDKEQTSNFVTVDTEQDITGIKSFVNGLKISDKLINIVDGILYLDCNVAITGGLTVYAQGTQDVPSIWDGAPFDNVTIHYNEETGLIEVIGGTGEGGIDNISTIGSGNAITSVTLTNEGKSLTFNKGETFATVTQLGTKWTQDNTKISNWDTAFSWGNHADAGYALQTYVIEELTKYVTLSTEQEITGSKHFTNGLSVGASKHRLYEQDGIVYFDGDLAVTGGITTYALGDRTPSTILDGLIIDENTLSKEGGKLSVIGGVGGASNWDELEGKPSWIGDTKPSYVWSEIGNKPTTLGDYGITANDILTTLKTVDGNGSGLDADLLDGYHESSFFIKGRDGFSNTAHDQIDTFVNRESGTYIISGPESSGLLTVFRAIGGSTSALEIFTWYDWSRARIRMTIDSNKYSSWKDLAFLDSNVASATNAAMLNGLNWNNFFSRRYYDFILNSYSTSNFYPLFFTSSDIELDCEIHSNNTYGGDAYNQNRIHFQLTTQGWNDVGTSFHLLSQNNYDNNEITIGAIGRGQHDGGIAIWVRGGRTYRVYSNREPVFKSSNYTYGDEVYSVGTNLWGGTNTYVDILWKNDSTRNKALIATLGGNVYSATKLQTARTIWGQSFDGTGNVSGELSQCTRIYNAASNPIYLGNSNNSSWVYTQDIASSSGDDKWAININGSAWFKRVNIGYTYSAEGTCLLNVNGTVRANSLASSNIKIECDNNGVIGSRNSEINNYNGNLYLQYNSSTDLYCCGGGGNVGIGTNSAKYKLDVNGVTKAYQYIAINNSSQYFQAYVSINEYITGTDPDYRWVWYHGIRDMERGFNLWSYDRNGTVYNQVASFSSYGGNTFKMFGNILATGGITCYASDQRAKTVIEQINLSLKQIANAPTIRFKWNDWKIKDDGKTHIGGIAQYMQKLLPETVLESDDMLNMDYATTGYIFAVQTAKHLVKTDTEVERLKKRVKRLEKQLKQLGYEEANIMDD